MKASQAIIDYIHASVAAAYSEQQIKEALLKAGWQAADIEAGLAEVNRPAESLPPVADSRRSALPEWLAKNKRLILISAAGVIILAAAAYFTRGLWQQKPEASAPVVASAQEPRKPADGKFADYDETKYRAIEIASSEDQACFAAQLMRKSAEAGSSSGASGEFSISGAYAYDIVFNGIVTESIRLDDAPRFSKDCSTIVFSGQADDDLFYVYKNGQKLNAVGASSRITFFFNATTGTVYYLDMPRSGEDAWQLGIDDKKTGPYAGANEAASPGTSPYYFVQFSPDGKSYAFKEVETNPEYTAWSKRRERETLRTDKPEVDALIKDEKLSDAELWEKLDGIIDSLSEEDAQQMIRTMAASTEALAEMEAYDEFAKTHWIRRTRLRVNGEPTQDFERIWDYHFSAQGDLRYTVSLKDGDYYFHDGKLERIFDYGSSSARKEYYGFQESPDGSQYAYWVTTYSNATPADPAIKKKYQDKYQVVINGKESELYAWAEAPGKVLFTKDGAHSAYIASLDGKQSFVVWDGQRGELLPVSSIRELRFIGNVLFYTNASSDESCLYINNQKNKCYPGTVSVSYNDPYYFLSGNRSVQPGEEPLENLYVSPETASLKQLPEPLIKPQNIHGGDSAVYFTADGQHMFYAQDMGDAGYEFKKDGQTVGRFQPTETEELASRFFPGKDRLSIRYFVNNKSTRQLELRTAAL